MDRLFKLVETSKLNDQRRQWEMALPLVGVKSGTLTYDVKTIESIVDNATFNLRLATLKTNLETISVIAPICNAQDR